MKTIATIDRKTLTDTVSFLKNSSGCKNRDMERLCELTITNNAIKMSTIGIITNEIECQATGQGKATFSLMKFYNLLKSYKTNTIELEILSGKLRVQNFSFTASTTYVEDDSILRSIQLPINYTDFHLLQLPHSNYTDEEIEFNKLTDKLYKAEERLKDKIAKTAAGFKLYGVNEKELRNILADLVNEQIIKGETNKPLK